MYFCRSSMRHSFPTTDVLWSLRSCLAFFRGHHYWLLELSPCTLPNDGQLLIFSAAVGVVGMAECQWVGLVATEFGTPQSGQPAGTVADDMSHFYGIGGMTYLPVNLSSQQHCL